MTVLRGARLVRPDGVRDGWLAVADGRIAAVGGPADPPPAGPALDLGGRLVVPGFVDLHVHGGGGRSVTTADPDDVATALALHRDHGTTTTLASLVTAPLPEMARAAAVLADCADAPADDHGGGRPVRPVGVHAEGPFLAVARCGAQDPTALRAPDPAALARLVDAARGHLRVVTIAPELPGALDLIRRVVAAGAVAAIGHTDADHAATRAGIDAGASLATHLFNGMRGVHHREPGPVLALLDAPEVVVELIADGHHLHDAVVAAVFRHVGAARVALVSDATAGAGAPDGRYALGRHAVEVRGGVARLADGDGEGALAGSTLTLDAALRRAVGAGVPLPDAVTALTATPARVLGLADRVGALRPGLDADLLVLGPALDVDGVMARGRWWRAPTHPA